MALVVKHAKNSGVADSGDASLVQPSDWNANHTLTGTETMVENTDIGRDPNQIPLNGFLGNMAFQNAEGLVVRPQSSAVPAGIGDMVFQLTSDTSLVIKVKGSDGTVRSTTLTLA